MAINDQEPRYRLLDSGGNIVASFYLDDSDGFNIQEATNQNEVTLASDGTFNAPTLDADSVIIAQELGLPEYGDVSNAPQTQGRFVYATGAGVSAEGIYKHDGASYTLVDGVKDGEDFDGEGTSDFTNLNSLDTSGLSLDSVDYPLTASSNPTWHEGDRVAVSGDSYATIFDIASSTVLHGGSILGYIPGFRLTIDGTVVVDRTTRALGENNNGDLTGVISVPSAVADSSMKLEVYNDSTNSGDFGWRVATE